MVGRSAVQNMQQGKLNILQSLPYRLQLHEAYYLSRDHKPYLEAEKERILKAGCFMHAGRVNGSLNLA
ncbi:phosphatase 2C (PP2C)-like protein [Corchorus capsularis]|uniref:Phosphatase 2C (PP2C)-like protein n=1 Tax=Corchorus capsularis TaxID=210143 RepID=A0A1R3JIX7_COCAP|nr:phosphatase 2C (PP2C)-like protein [Corchorus capsularis]